MKLITAYIQPHKLQDVKQSLYKNEVFKMSVTNALGCGEQKGYHESYRGVDFEVNLLKTVDAIIEGARTGKIGDGKIFITDLSKCVRIRTGEEGGKAIG
ncbi:MAG: P-II family nitrogen regulator [Planctomycetota bacterium]|jgi:nitrogen regulatory protein P-II 1